MGAFMERVFEYLKSEPQNFLSGFPDIIIGGLTEQEHIGLARLILHKQLENTK